MFRRLLILSALAVASVAASPRPAHAGGPTQGAREHFESAQARYESRDYEGAAAEFRAAYQDTPAASFIYNEAICYERLADPTKAKALFARYLEALQEHGPRSSGTSETRDLGGLTSAPGGLTITPAVGPDYAGLQAGLRF